MAERRSVLAKNVGDRPWDDMYSGEQYQIRAGGQAVVPWEAACLWLGCPDFRDDPLHNRYWRRDEYERVRFRYGVTINEDKWDARRPRLEIHSLGDPSERILMVIDDPDGDKADAPPFTVGEITALEYAQRLEAELDSIKKRLRIEDAEVEQGEIPEDEPAKVPTGAGGPRSRRGSSS